MVGICSYLLVSFWFTRIAANQSSLSALLTNRVGDCFLTIGMFALLWSFGNIDYATVFSLAPFMSENIVTIIGICLLIGAMAKSSQVGLHVWLPMAMEGPTPVSALIHAATMVTAGVYLLMRCSPLIEYSSTVLILCLWLGAITTVFSSLVGLFQQDIKKVIAYSTMSQLGMMVIAVGLSSYNIALFHLVNHAFYKALLFLGAGMSTVPALISANCWKLLWCKAGLALIIGQSAGNLDNGRGFFRDYMLKISYKIIFVLINLNIRLLLIKQFFNRQVCLYTSKVNKAEDNNFSSYLAGLIEGDGCIYIPKKERDNNNEIISPIISIAFNAKDLPLAVILQQKLATGQLIKVKSKNAYTLRISNYKNLALIVNVINGFMRTPKIQQLNKLIYYLNDRGYDFKLYPKDRSSFQTNAWLAGFIDADGCFYLRASLDKVSGKLKRIACCFELEQSQLDLNGNDTSEVLCKIGEFIGCEVKNTKSKYEADGIVSLKYRIRTTSLKGNLSLKSYLSSYPLFSSKFLDYKDWLMALEYFERKEHKRLVTNIIKIKSDMNNKRTFFNWDHLQRFYNIYN